MSPIERVSHLIEQAYLCNEAAKFAEAVEVLTSMKGWRNKFTARYISMHLEKRVLDRIEAGTSSAEIEQWVRELISDMDSYSGVSTIYFPINGLKLTKPLEIGLTTFYSHSERRINDLRRQARAAILKTSSSQEVKQSSIKSLNKWYIESFTSKAYAEVKVKAEKEKATEVAIDEIEKSLDVIRLAIPRVAGRSKNEFAYETRIHIQGQESAANRNHFAFDNKGMRFGSKRQLNRDLVIKGRQAWKQLRDLGTPQLSAMLKSESKTGMEEQLLNSVHWFSLGVAQRNPDHQYLSYAFAVESLVGSKDFGGSITNSIVETTAYLLASEREQRLRVRDRMKEALKPRNELVHGSTKVSLEMRTIRSLEGLSLGRADKWGVRLTGSE